MYKSFHQDDDDDDALHTDVTMFNNIAPTTSSDDFRSDTPSPSNKLARHHASSEFHLSHVSHIS